jgi:hypothetical protein
MRTAFTRLVRRDRSAGGRTPAPLVRPGPRPPAGGAILPPIAFAALGRPRRTLTAAIVTTVTNATAVPRRSFPGPAASRARRSAILATPAGGPILRTAGSRPRAPPASAALATARRPVSAVPASTVPVSGAGAAGTGPLAGAVGISVRGSRPAPVGAGACIVRPGCYVPPRGPVLALRPTGSVTR